MHTSQFMTYLFPAALFIGMGLWAFFQRRGN